MLSTIAPRWPRAFTSIGFGLLALFLSVGANSQFVARQQSLAGGGSLQTAVENAGASQFVESVIENSGENSLLLLGIGSLFVGYVTGEMLLLIARPISGTNGAKWAKRLAFVVTKDNSYLITKFEAHLDKIRVLEGLAGLLICIAIVGLFFSVLTYDWTTAAMVPLAVFGCFMIGRTVAIIGEQVDREHLEISKAGNET